MAGDGGIDQLCLGPHGVLRSIFGSHHFGRGEALQGIGSPDNASISDL